MPTGEPRHTWSESKRQKFAADWNAGELDTDALKDKYGVRSPGKTAAWLRRDAKLVLRDRRGKVAE